MLRVLIDQSREPRVLSAVVCIAELAAPEMIDGCWRADFNLAVSGTNFDADDPL